MSNVNKGLQAPGFELMTKRTILLTVSTTIAIPLVYLLFFSQSAIEDFHSQISKELPRGSTKQQVFDFLEARRIRPGDYHAGPDPYVGLPDEDRQFKRCVRAIIVKNHKYVPFMTDYTIRIYFYFDENQNLEEFKLQRLDDVL